jgi:nitroreductase
MRERRCTPPEIKMVQLSGRKQKDMDIPFSRWNAVIASRRSKRQYDPAKPVLESLLTELAAVCNQFTPFTGTRSVLAREGCSEVFRGLIGSYGKITGVTAFIAFIGDIADLHVQEKVGFTGEGIILEATAMGLATCWVGGAFNPEAAASLIKLEPGDRVLAVTPVGYPTARDSLSEKSMAGFGLNHKRKPLSALVTGLEMAQWSEWIRISLEAARLAPSGVNRQPWSFHVERDAITVSVRTKEPDFNISKRLDCGIAMAHIEIAAMSCGKSGKWEFLNSPQVARFSVGSV